MKIISLEIEGYKMFQPRIKLDLGKDFHLFIGVNGSGKSSILEAIALLFTTVKRYCEDGKTRERPFNFRIEYSFNDFKVLKETTTTQESFLSIRHVIISTSKESGLDFTMIVDGQEINKRNEMLHFLPKNLIFYYAGFNKVLENIVHKFEQENAEKLYYGKKKNTISGVLQKNITFIRPEQYPVLFLVNFIDREQLIPQTNRQFSIHSINFHLKKPQDFRNYDFQNFFNLKGFLRDYLENLRVHSQRLEIDKESNEMNLTVEYHRGLIEAIEDLGGLLEHERFNMSRYYTFHIINLLFHIGILKKISVSIIDSHGKIFSVDDLSEGEQQLITIDAIKNVLSCDNSVMFFDEPDSFLHPQRQRQLMPHTINKISKFDNQIIATTHSPLVAQSVDFSKILLFERDGSLIKTNSKVLDTESINRILFGVDERFSESVEEKLKQFENYRNDIFLDKHINTASLKILVEELQSLGEETEAIVNRELSQLKRLKKFDLFGTD